MLKKIAFIILLCTFLISIFYRQIPLQSNAIRDPLKIFRDQNGIAHVVAKNKQDLFYGIGYAQAQDRLWSIHFKKMLMDGRINQIFGNQGMPLDRYMRNINIKRVGQMNQKLLDEETRRNLQSYARGMNQYVKRTRILPFQFYLFWTQWENWTPANTNSCVGLFNFILQFDWMYELARQRLKQVIGYEFAMKLIPSNTKDLFEEITIIKDDQLKEMGRYKFYNKSSYLDVINQHWKNLHIDFTMESTDKLNNFFKTIGSNAWIIGEKHSANGRNILANDPHLGLMMPTIFYPIQLILIDDNNDVIDQSFGAMTDGLPALTIGRNKYYAWGSTALYADNKDIFLEELKQENGKMYYLLQNQWKELKQRKQVYNIRGVGPTEQTFYQTHRGPIISTIFLDLHLKYGINIADHHKNMLSLESIVYVPDNSSVKALIDLAFLNNRADFMKANQGIKIINIDSVFIADDDQPDTLFGYHSTGRIPKKNFQEMGSYIKNGTTRKYDHLEYYNIQQMPKLLNPQRGYVAMTNNKFASDNFDLRGSLHQISNGRASRIEDLITTGINNGKKFTIQDMMKMQLDVKDVFVQKCRRDLIKILKSHSKQWKNKIFVQKLIQRLQTWNCEFDIDSIGASIYATWEHEFQALLLLDKNLTESERVSITNHAFFEIYQFKLINRLGSNQQTTQEDILLCQNHFTIKSKEVNPCVINMIHALNKLEATLYKEFDTLDDKQWKWGHIHRKKYVATPWSQIPLIQKIWSRKVPAPGNSRTLNVGIHTYQTKTFNTFATPTFRFITDLNQTFFSLDLGVTDRVTSPYFDNFLHSFNIGEYQQYIRINPLKEQVNWTSIQILKNEKK